MTGLLITAVFCFGITYVLFTVRKWVYATKWNMTVKLIVVGLSMHILLLFAMVASMPFLDPIITELTFEENPNEIHHSPTGRTFDGRR